MVEPSSGQTLVILAWPVDLFMAALRFVIMLDIDCSSCRLELLSLSLSGSEPQQAGVALPTQRPSHRKRGDQCQRSCHTPWLAAIG